LGRPLSIPELSFDLAFKFLCLDGKMGFKTSLRILFVNRMDSSFSGKKKAKLYLKKLLELNF
jgi:hypothetical protein